MTTATNSALDRFLDTFQPSAYGDYIDRLESIVGYRYPFSTTPVFLTSELFERLRTTTHAIVKLLKSENFQDFMRQYDYFLPWNGLRELDYFGCVDFHLQGDEARIIEVNFGVPGRTGLLEVMEREFYRAFDLPDAFQINAGFEDQLVQVLSADSTIPSVAVAVNSTAASEELRPHYEYVASIFRQHGIDSQVVFANEVELERLGAYSFVSDSPGLVLPSWSGRTFDRVLNLLIPRIWEDNQDLFSNYTQLYRSAPETICPSPQGWRLGNKRILTALNNLGNQRFGLDDEDVRVLNQATLKSKLVTEFQSVNQLFEEFDGPENLVLKPLASYRSQGVYVCPTSQQAESVLNGDKGVYVAQEVFMAEHLPSVTPEGLPSQSRFEVRMGFMNGRVNRVRGSNCDNLEMTPVVVVP